MPANYPSRPRTAYDIPALVCRTWAECIRRERFRMLAITKVKAFETVEAHLKDEECGHLPLPFRSLVRQLQLSWEEDLLGAISTLEDPVIIVFYEGLPMKGATL